MATVWLIQQPKGIKRERGGYWEPDLSSAAQFGRIVPLLEADDRPNLLPVPMSLKMRSRLMAEYKQDDFFLWAGGDPAALFIAGGLAHELGYPEIKFLRWERTRERDASGARGGYYIPTTIRYRSLHD